MAMQVAEHIPHCVQQRNLLHTDSPFDIGTETVLFPDLSLRPGRDVELVDIEWTTRTFYERQRGIRIPYKNKTGKFHCNTLEAGRQRATSAEWQVSVKFLKNVNQDIAATTMQVAELNPYCVSSQDSFHTDMFSNAPLLGGKKVIFPLFSVRTEQNENIAIRWLQDDFFKAHKTVRVPYNERIGTFVSPTMSGQGRTSHNAEWEIRIKFLKYEFNNGLIAAPPKSKPEPAAARAKRGTPHTRTKRYHAYELDEELSDNRSESSDDAQDELSEHDSDDTDVEFDRDMEYEEEQEELAHQAVLAGLRADHNKQIQVLRKQAEYKADLERQQADQRRAVDLKKKTAADKIAAARAAKLAKEVASKQKNDAARRALEVKQSNARASMDKHRRDEVARQARHAVNKPRRDLEINNLRRKQDEDVRPFNDPQGAPAHRSRHRDTKQAEQRFNDDRMKGKTPAQIAEILRREKGVPTDDSDDQVPLLVDNSSVKPPHVSPSVPATQTLRPSPVRPDAPPPPLPRTPVKPSKPPPPVPPAKRESYLEFEKKKKKELEDFNKTVLAQPSASHMNNPPQPRDPHSELLPADKLHVTAPAPKAQPSSTIAQKRHTHGNNQGHSEILRRDNARRLEKVKDSHAASKRVDPQDLAKFKEKNAFSDDTNRRLEKLQNRKSKGHAGAASHAPPPPPPPPPPPTQGPASDSRPAQRAAGTREDTLNQAKSNLRPSSPPRGRSENAKTFKEKPRKLSRGSNGSARSFSRDGSVDSNQSESSSGPTTRDSSADSATSGTASKTAPASAPAAAPAASAASSYAAKSAPKPAAAVNTTREASKTRRRSASVERATVSSTAKAQTKHSVTQSPRQPRAASANGRAGLESREKRRRTGWDDAVPDSRAERTRASSVHARRSLVDSTSILKRAPPADGKSQQDSGSSVKTPRSIRFQPAPPPARAPPTSMRPNLPGKRQTGTSDPAAQRKKSEPDDAQQAVADAMQLKIPKKESFGRNLNLPPPPQSRQGKQAELRQIAQANRHAGKV